MSGPDALEAIRRELHGLAQRHGWSEVALVCAELAAHPRRRVVLAYPDGVDVRPLRELLGPDVPAVPLAAASPRLVAADVALVALAADDLVPAAVADAATALRQAGRPLAIVLLAGPDSTAATVARDEANAASVTDPDPTARVPRFDGSTCRFLVWCGAPAAELAERVERDARVLRGLLADDLDAGEAPDAKALGYAIGLAQRAVECGRGSTPEEDGPVRELLDSVSAQRRRLLAAVDTELATARGEPGSGSGDQLTRQAGARVGAALRAAPAATASLTAARAVCDELRHWVAATGTPSRERYLLARDEAGAELEQLAERMPAAAEPVLELVTSIRQLDLVPPEVPTDADAPPTDGGSRTGGVPDVVLFLFGVAAGFLLPLPPVVGPLVGGTVTVAVGRALSGGDRGADPATVERLVAVGRGRAAQFRGDWTRELQRVGTATAAAFDGAFAALTTRLGVAEPSPAAALEDLHERLLPHLLPSRPEGALT